MTEEENVHIAKHRTYWKRCTQIGSRFPPLQLTKNSSLFTDRVRSTRREVIFSLCFTPHLGGGVPHLARGGTPAKSRWGVPQLGPMGGPRGTSLAGGTPPVQDSIWSTWYAAVDMPLAFTQEDFLVPVVLSVFVFYKVFQVEWEPWLHTVPPKNLKILL